MKIRRMGRTGLKVSEVCLGTMTFGHQCDEKTSFAIMKKADALSAHRIAFAPVPMEGLGEAINDRLARAAAPRD